MAVAALRANPVDKTEAETSLNDDDDDNSENDDAVVAAAAAAVHSDDYKFPVNYVDCNNLLHTRVDELRD